MDRDLHTIDVKVGNSMSRLSLRSLVGIGSSSQALAGDFIIILLTSSSVTGRKKLCLAVVI